MYGICHLSLVPCRKEPSDRSELVTELLFGECFTVSGTSGSWSRIITERDQYECWIDTKQFLPLNADEYQLYCTQPRFFSTEIVHVLSSENHSPRPLLLGSTLPEFENGEIRLSGKAWKYEGQAVSSQTETTRRGLVQTAMLYLDAPYRWGGRTPFGIDCSGFTQMVYVLNGKQLRRDAFQQAEQGSLLSFIEEASAGDLAFFDNAEGRIIHVGIILQGSRIIHASGQVRIDPFDHHGIYHSATGKYSHNLRMIRSIL